MRFITLLSLLLIVSITHGQSSSDALEVKEADAKLSALIRNNDAAEAAKFYVHDFSLTTSHGSFKDRDDIIREIASPQLQFEIHHTEDVDVIVDGHKAVLRGVRYQKGVLNGKSFETRLKVTETWVRTVHGWKILSGHTSEIPKI